MLLLTHLQVGCDSAHLIGAWLGPLPWAVMAGVALSLLCYLLSSAQDGTNVRWNLRSLKFWTLNWFAVNAGHLHWPKQVSQLNSKSEGSVVAELKLELCFSECPSLRGSGGELGTREICTRFGRWKQNYGHVYDCHRSWLRTCWLTLSVWSSSQPTTPVPPTRSPSASLHPVSSVKGELHQFCCRSAQPLESWRQGDTHVGSSSFL